MHRDLVETRSQVKSRHETAPNHPFEQVVSPVTAIPIRLGMLVDGYEVHAKPLVRPRAVRRSLHGEHRIASVEGRRNLADNSMLDEFKALLVNDRPFGR
jgi:hypothetical protein